MKEDARRIREEEKEEGEGGFKENPEMVGGLCSMILSSTCFIRHTDTKQNFCLKLSAVYRSS